MGADLFLASVCNEAREKYLASYKEALRLRDNAATTVEFDIYQKDVERYSGLMNPENGYFRDSYNDSCLLWRWGMSWWDNPFVEDGTISPERAEEFLLVLNHIITPPDWGEYFDDKKRRLIRLLETAISKGESIIADV
jgi:hypothetical protein